MKFIKNFSFDIRNGFLKNKLLFLVPAGIGAFSFFDFTNRVDQIKQIPMFSESCASYGDLWMYLYGGMKEYLPSSKEALFFPIIWLVTLMVIAFLVLNYPLNNILTSGQQVLVRTGSRSQFWLSKCCWNILSTVFYHAVVAAVTILLCLLSGIPLSRHIDMELLRMLFEAGPETSVLDRSIIPCRVLLLPILVSVTINLLQMTFSLFVKPIFSFLGVSVLLIFSAYLLRPYMFGNYAMLLRGRWIMENGVSETAGFLLCALLTAGAVLTGLIRFRRYDILNRN